MSKIDFGKRVRLLKDHADLAAQLDHVRIRRVNVAPVNLDRAHRARPRNGVVHAVQRAQESRLAAPRRANKGHHEPFGDVHGDFIKRLCAAIKEIKVAHLDLGRILRSLYGVIRPPLGNLWINRDRHLEISDK